ncbi:MAG: aldose epimerase family protein [Candidatus Kryptoniota bacterium]
MIGKSFFGELPDCRSVYSYTLRKSSGMNVKIIDYGAAIVSISVPNQNGEFADVALGYDDLMGYMNGKFFLGAIVGRYANRIDKGTFQLDGKIYHLSLNDAENHLHGGDIGFHKVLWAAKPLETPNGPALELTYVSNDGEEGYPGTVTVRVTYTLIENLVHGTDNNMLQIDCIGWTDKPTILNLSNHAYFNLTGDPTQSILDHELVIDANKYTPVNGSLIPTGELAEVAGTPMDFRKPTKIGLCIDSDNKQLKQGGGYDLNWVLNSRDKMVRKAAEVCDPTSGRVLEVFTDQPGLQFYSGNFLDGSEKGKNGIFYKSRSGLALETQLFPNSPNEPGFPSSILRPGEKYKQTTIYKFSVSKRKF